jgi:hypothetical protein
LPIEWWLRFYPRRLLEILVVNLRWSCLFARFGAIKLIARWEIFRSSYGESLASNKEQPMGSKLMESYFDNIPESQRRTVDVLKELDTEIARTALSANLDVMVTPRT